MGPGHGWGGERGRDRMTWKMILTGDERRQATGTLFQAVFSRRGRDEEDAEVFYREVSMIPAVVESVRNLKADETFARVFQDMVAWWIKNGNPGERSAVEVSLVLLSLAGLLIPDVPEDWGVTRRIAERCKGAV